MTLTVILDALVGATPRYTDFECPVCRGTVLGDIQEL